MSAPAPGSSPPFKHAVVMGSSIAGMLTARVLADHFERVTILERDPLPDTPEFRKGAPQARHLHFLLRRGADIFGRYFPNLRQDLLEGGALEMEFGPELAWFHFGGWKTRAPTGIKAVLSSRAFLEYKVRCRVRATPRVEVLPETEVLGLHSSADKRRVEGVVLRRSGGPEETLAAQLVVDATGRGTRVPAWLEAMGRSRVQESELKINVGYATRIFKRPAEPFGWKTLYILGASPETKRQGIVTCIEGDRWIATLAGLCGDHPPSDEAGWYEYAKALPSRKLYEAVQKAEPLTDVTCYKFPAHLRRHYERMRDFPEGLVVIGDAQCSFNPVYAQGMTTSAIAADLLGQHLAQAAQAATGGAPPARFGARYQRALGKLMNDPWATSTGEDMRYPEVEGQRPFGLGFLLWYLKRYHRLCTTDPALTQAFYHVMNMTASPRSIMTPGSFWKVLKGPPAPQKVEAQAQSAME